MSMFLSVVAGQGGVVVPGAPGTLSLSAGSPVYTVISLSWSAPSDTGGGTVSGYKIEISTNSGGSWSTEVADTGSTGTSYSDTGLTANTRYDYRVSAINEIGTGAVGNAPNHTTTAYAVPGAPGTLSLAEGSDGNTQINLSWSAPSSDGGQAVTGYRIKKDGSVLVADTSSTGTTYTASGLTANTSYNFNVAAINSVGTGTDGNTPSRTTTNVMTITTTGSPSTQSYSGYVSYTYTGSGSFNVTSNPGSVACDYFAVAGGGGTTEEAGSIAEGGGGGAMCTRFPDFNSTSTGNYTIVIGAGGAGGSEGSGGMTSVTGTGISGDDRWTRGGGAGGHPHVDSGDTQYGRPSGGGSDPGYSAGYGGDASIGSSHDDIGNGGNGTGGSTSGNVGQGGNGGGMATNAPSNSIQDSIYGHYIRCTDGGAGFQNDYRTGSDIYYAGGGGGTTYFSGSWAYEHVGADGGAGGGGNGSMQDGRDGENGEANKGGGAGGDDDEDRTGGSGVVIIRVPA